METFTLKNKPSIILRDGKPSAVILELEDYEELLQRLQDYEDIAYIEQIKKEGNLEFISLDDFLKEIGEENV
jgi:PHD/YefM family antitoxin component YafN of YafNO toxin-antitoxin module